MAVDWEQCSRLVPHLFQDDLLAKGSLVRHDPRSLARLIKVDPIIKTARGLN